MFWKLHLRLALTIALLATVSSIPYTLSYTFPSSTSYRSEVDMPQDNSIIVIGTFSNTATISKRDSNGSYILAQTITFSNIVKLVSISLDGQTIAVGDSTKTEIYTYNSGTGQFDLTQTLTSTATNSGSGSMTDDAQWLAKKSNTQ